MPRIIESNLEELSSIYKRLLSIILSSFELLCNLWKLM